MWYNKGGSKGVKKRVDVLRICKSQYYKENSYEIGG